MMNARHRKSDLVPHRFVTPIATLSHTYVSPSFLHLFSPFHALCRNANDAASRTSARISCLLALLISTLSEIIGASVHNNCTSQHALRADQLDQLVSDGALGVALAVSLEVAEITDMAVGVGGGAVLFGVWVD